MTAVAGSISGEIRISARQAIAEYAAVRAANATTRTALLASSAAFAKVGVAALAAAAPIVLLFTAAATEAAKFQKKIDYFGAITNASSADMTAIAQKAMDMSTTTVYSANQMADAFVEFAKAGIGTKDILGGVADATASLAQAADISIQEAANTIVATMSTFHMAASDTMSIANEMAGAANASIIDVTDLAVSLKYAGGIAAATKIPFNSLVTAISLLGNAGIKGSTAGTSLRQIMVSLLGNSKAATNQLKALGIITKDGTNLFIDQTGHLKPLAEVFQILKDHTASLTDAERLRATKIIFNNRALAAANILMHGGAKAFADMNAQIAGVTAADVARKRLDNLSGDVTRLKNSVITMLIQAGGPLQNFLRVIVQGLTAAVRWFGNLSPGMQQAILIGLGVVGAFLLILGILSMTIALVLKTIAVYKDLRAAFLLVRAGIIMVSTAFRAAALALLTNPVFLVIAAIVALGIAFVMLYRHSETFRRIVHAALHAVAAAAKVFWDAMVAVFNWIKTNWITIIAILAGPVGWAFLLIRKYWSNITGAFRNAYNAISDVIGKIVDVFQSIYNAIAGAITNVINFVAYHWKAIIAIVLGPLGLLIDAITTHWDWIYNKIMTVVHAIETALGWVWNRILNAAKAVWDPIAAYFRTWWDGMQVIFTTAMTAIETAWNAISSFFSTLWNGIVAIFTGAINAVEGLLSAVWQAIGPPLFAFWNGVSGFFSRLWRNIYNFFSGMLGAIFNRITTSVHNITTAVSNIATGLWNGISGIFTTMYQTLSSIAGKVMSYFSAAGTWLLNAGKNIVIGLWNGVASMAGWIWDHISRWASQLWHGVLDFFGIKSPSTKGFDVGKNIVLGIASGITNTSVVATTAVQKMNEAIMAAHQASMNSGLSVATSGMINLQASMGASSQAAMMNGTQGKLGSSIGTNIENLNVINAKPETASDSLPRTIRNIGYVTSGPSQ